MIDDKNPLFTLSISEFKILIVELVEEALAERDKVDKKKKDSCLDEAYLSIPELAAFLKCSKVSIHTYKNMGLPYFKMGRRVLFKKSEVIEFMERNRRKRIINNY